MADAEGHKRTFPRRVAFSKSLAVTLSAAKGLTIWEEILRSAQNDRPPRGGSEKALP